MGGNPKSKNKKLKKQMKQQAQASSTTGTINLNGFTSGPITISSNLGGTYRPELPEYQIKGFKSISDYMSGQSPIYVTQQDGLTEDELYEIYDETLKYPEIGKPFHGIVVDRFVPRITTEQGEVVDLPRPRLYKVLINESNCLWVEETDLAPMKPEECPLKEEYVETEEK
jgi:hypothetical protein